MISTYYCDKAIYAHFLFKPLVSLLYCICSRWTTVWKWFIWYTCGIYQLVTRPMIQQAKTMKMNKTVYTKHRSLFPSWCSTVMLESIMHVYVIGTILRGISVLLSRINTACVGYHIFIIKVSLSCLTKFPRENNRNVTGYMLHVEETLQNLAQPCFDCCLHGWLSFKFTHLTFSYYRWVTNLLLWYIEK